jgi:hypothetical protein
MFICTLHHASGKAQKSSARAPSVMLNFTAFLVSTATGCGCPNQTLRAHYELIVSRGSRISKKTSGAPEVLVIHVNV